VAFGLGSTAKANPGVASAMSAAIIRMARSCVILPRAWADLHLINFNVPCLRQCRLMAAEIDVTRHGRCAASSEPLTLNPRAAACRLI
jgi:hypothetical protein